MRHHPRIEEQSAYYDRWNTKYRRGDFDNIDREMRIRALNVYALIKNLNLPNPRVLEVGCGTGWFAEKLSELGTITAIDLSPAAIAIARERHINAEFIAGDFHEHAFSPASFDIVICAETLFYVDDQSRFLQKLVELMADGGYLALTTINKFVYERSGDIRPPEHGQVRNWLSKRQLRKMVAQHVKILSMTTVEPRGDRGLLRLVNSHKINRWLEKIFAIESIKHAKEKCGLGGGVILWARKTNQVTPRQG